MVMRQISEGDTIHRMRTRRSIGVAGRNPLA